MDVIHIINYRGRHRLAFVNSDDAAAWELYDYGMMALTPENVGLIQLTCQLQKTQLQINPNVTPQMKLHRGEILSIETIENKPDKHPYLYVIWHNEYPIVILYDDNNANCKTRAMHHLAQLRNRLKADNDKGMHETVIGDIFADENVADRNEYIAVVDANELMRKSHESTGNAIDFDELEKQ